MIDLVIVTKTTQLQMHLETQIWKISNDYKWFNV